MPKMSQRQALVSIEGLPGLWATKSGGNISADASPVWDGGSSSPEMLAGPAAAENVTISRPFDEQRDLPLLKTLRRQVGRLRATITCQPTNADLAPVGPPTVYPQALLLSMTEPEVDAASSDAQTIELEWGVEQFV